LFDSGLSAILPGDGRRANVRFVPKATSVVAAGMGELLFQQGAVIGLQLRF
jgi:hypothetical protein